MVPSSSKPQTVTVSVMAALLCITERRVQQLAKEGIIPKGARGNYELIPSVQGYIRYLQEESRQGVGGSQEFKDSKARLALARAESEEIKLRILKDEIVTVQEVVGAWADILTIFKSRMRSIPSELAPLVRMAKSDGQAQEQLREKIDEALHELSQAEVEFARREEPSEAGPAGPERGGPTS